MALEFVEFPKIPRLFRDIVITEKIDGTNAAIVISNDGSEIGAQSRNRAITVEADNAGFAKWVQANKELLLRLGPGHHYGEWWGKGIQRNYGMEEKKFSLFNVARWSDLAKWNEAKKIGLDVVPILYEGPFYTAAVDRAIEFLKTEGSLAAPGFMKPEGVIVFHKAANKLFKVTVEKDDEWKGKSAA